MGRVVRTKSLCHHTALKKFFMCSSTCECEIVYVIGKSVGKIHSGIEHGTCFTKTC